MVIISSYENQCTICEGHYVTKKWYYGNDITCKEVNFITAHPKCRNLMVKKTKLESKLCDLEWELFIQKYNECKYT